MRQVRAALLILLCSIASFGSPQEESGEPLEVVLWLGGFAHEFATVGSILGDVLPQQHPMQMSVAWNGDFLDAPEWPDVILMYHCHESTKDVLTEPQKDKLLAMVEAGVGVVALHASYYSFLEWDEYHELYGARFLEHGASEVRLRVTPIETQHPIFSDIDGPLEIISELYHSTPVPADCHVLAHSQENGRGEPQPSIWTRRYGKGRVVTILPGHFADNYREAPLQRLILNSMAWVVEGEATKESTAVEREYDWEKAALSAFRLPEGFEISLVAAEPHLANPISMTLDEEGRIYVANAHSYRQKWWLMKPPPAMEPSNPVVRLTLGPEGRAIEATTAAEGFEDPVMGLAVRGKRLWATNLDRLFVTRLDDRGRMVGPRRTLVRDAATPWNPFGMYRAVFGPDGLLYLTIGDHATQLTGTAGTAAVRLDDNGSGAVFRCREDGSDLELLLEGMRAPFTVGFTPFGRLWVITNGEGSPNCLLDAVRGADYRFRNRGPNDWSWLTGAEPMAAPVWETPPGAHTAVQPYYSSALPEEYWGCLFVSNFGVHGAPAKKNEVLRLVLDDRGRVLSREAFISSSDSRFRPTQVSLAPDGSLYMLDWYGQDDENDLTGRLYRICYTGKNAAPRRGSGLGDRNHTQRRKSKAALLAASPASSLPLIAEALSGEDALAAAEALWTLRRSEWAAAADYVRKAYSHGDWRVRRLAAQLLREMGQQNQEDAQRLLADPDPAVQLEAALGIRDAPRRCTALVEALRGGAAEIRRLRFAAALEIARHGRAEHFVALLTSDDADMRLAGLIALDEAFYESSKGFKTPHAAAHEQRAEIDRRIVALRADPHERGAAQELERLEQKSSQLASEGLAPALTARRVLAQLIAEPGTLDTNALLDLARRWPHASLKSSVNEVVKARLGRADVSAAGFALGLDALERMELPTSTADIDRWRIRLLDDAAERGIEVVAEKTALLRVLEAGDARAGDLPLLKRFGTDENATVRATALRLLGSRFAGDAAAVEFCRDLALNDAVGLAQRLDALITFAELEKTPDEDNWTQLLLSSRREIALASLRGLQECRDRAAARQILENAAEQLSRQHGSAVDDDLAFASATLGGKQIASANKTDLRNKALADTMAGSPELGRLVFWMRDCHVCHADEDAEVRAPPLDQIAATHDAEYLIDSILDPDKAVKTGFLTHAIGLRDGEIITGTLRRNISGDGRWDEVTDDKGRRTLYRSDDIANVKASSAMPSGLEATMSRTELVDLIAYLRTLK
ncbi:MAG: hypothetical protein GY711_26650 [bacterium]|nr:hypothetical protein [bacterium]